MITRSDHRDGVHPFKVEVLADRSGVWATNGLSFETVEDAVVYAHDLYGRWTSVSQWRVNSIGGVAAEMGTAR
jgi:hypothetical protein